MTFLAVRPRGVVTGWSVGTTTATITLPEVADGDVIVVFIGGGNRVTAYPPGWDFEEYLTGQEAQGIVLSKFDGTSADSGTTISVDFDGGDPRFVAAIAVQNAQYWVVNESYRHGTAGSTFTAGDHAWTADQYQGDLSATFAFARNASTAPTMGRGLLWNPDATTYAGSAGALFLESLPTYSTGEPFTVGLPERSGAVVYSIAFYRRNTLDWEASPTYELTTSTLTAPRVEGVFYGSGSRSSPSGYPTVTDADFRDATENAEWVSGVTGTIPVEWSPDQSVDIFSGIYTSSWDSTRRARAWSMALTDDQRTPPSPSDIPDDYEGLEYEVTPARDGTYVTGLVAEFGSESFNEDTTGGSSQPVATPDYATGVFAATGFELTGETFPYDVATWGGGYSGSPLHRVFPEAAGTETVFTVDLLGLVSDVSTGEFAVAVVPTDVTGSGYPAVELAGHATGYAWFAAYLDLGDVTYTLQPPDRRFIVRRAPVVDLLAPLASVLRRYPRDDAYGFGNVARNYPPPRRRRNYGQQP